MCLLQERGRIIDIADSDIIICDCTGMSRKELEEFADRMRIERNTLLLEKETMDTHEFMGILKHLVQEKKDLQKRLDIMEEILHSYIPIINKDEEECI
jgi:tRNA 2-selenouridine synthase SelU